MADAPLRPEGGADRRGRRDGPRRTRRSPRSSPPRGSTPPARSPGCPATRAAARSPVAGRGSLQGCRSGHVSSSATHGRIQISQRGKPYSSNAIPLPPGELAGSASSPPPRPPFSSRGRPCRRRAAGGLVGQFRRRGRRRTPVAPRALGRGPRGGQSCVVRRARALVVSERTSARTEFRVSGSGIAA